MKLTVAFFATLLAVAPACKGKDDKAAPSTKEGTAGTAAKAAPTCKPGELIQGDTCVVAVTPDAVAAVKQQGTQVDALMATLDDVSKVSGPIELLNAFTQMDAWKTLVGLVPDLAKAEGVISGLDGAVKQLAAFKVQLADVRARLGNVDGELTKILETTGTQQKLEDARAKISAELTAAVKTMDAELQHLVEQTIVPLSVQVAGVSEVIDGACALGKLKGGGAEMQKLCDDAKVKFADAKAYLATIQQQPAVLTRELTTAIETKLPVLLDEATKTAVDEAQKRVDALLATPAPGSADKPLVP